MLKLYENIKFYRKQSNMTQEDLAKRMGYTDRSSIAKIERGLVDLPQSKIVQFADIFGVSAGDLMGWEEVTEEKKKDNDMIANVVARMSTDRDFYDFVVSSYSFDSEKIKGMTEMLKVFSKDT